MKAFFALNGTTYPVARIKDLSRRFHDKTYMGNSVDYLMVYLLKPVIKQTSNNMNDIEIKKLCLGNHMDEDCKNYWIKIAIKGNGFEEYIFYSTDINNKICNYECVRYAL